MNFDIFRSGFHKLIGRKDSLFLHFLKDFKYIKDIWLRALNIVSIKGRIKKSINLNILKLILFFLDEKNLDLVN